MPVILGGPGVVPSNQNYGQIELQAGQAWIVPAGRWEKAGGRYINIQEWDPITQIWRTLGGGSAEAPPYRVVSDGENYRLVNQTGFAVGALLTNAGSGYTSAPTVTGGGAIWRAIMGSVISTTITVTNGGTNYSYPPMVIISPPPAGGIQATAYCTLSGGAVSTVTVVDQGAGYTTVPTVSFVNDPREGINNVAQGYNAAAVASLTGSGTINAIVCVDHGGTGPLTSVPSLTITGGGGSSGAATAIMCWSITAYAAGTAGAGLTGTVARITGEDAFPTTTAAYLNPTTQSNLVKVRSADIKAPISSGGITATGAVYYDGGIYTSVPTPLVIPSASVVTTAPVVTFTMGGQNDVCSLFAT